MTEENVPNGMIPILNENGEIDMKPENEALSNLVNLQSGDVAKDNIRLGLIEPEIARSFEDES